MGLNSYASQSRQFDMPQHHTAARPRSGRPLMTTPEAARYLGLAKNTLEKMRIHGRRDDNAPRFVRLGTAVRYDPDELDAHIERNSAISTSEYDPGFRG